MAPFNLGAAYTGQREAGILPSLQTLGRMSPGETDVFRGYAQGVAGIPWNDIVSNLSEATKSLRSARRAY